MKFWKKKGYKLETHTNKLLKETGYFSNIPSTYLDWTFPTLISPKVTPSSILAVLERGSFTMYDGRFRGPGLSYLVEPIARTCQIHYYTVRNLS